MKRGNISKVEPIGTYSYDGDNRISAVLNAFFVAEYHYTSDGYDAGYTLTSTNGVLLDRAVVRDAYRRQLISLVSNQVDSAVVSSYQYDYDTLARATNRNDDTFGYNASSEVSSASILSNAYTYAYDFIGNHTTSSVDAVETTYVANALNQYSQISVPSVPSVDNLSYDLDGNMLTNGVWTYTYDAENRLTAVYSNSVCVISNAYDHSSRRVAKWTPSHTTTFVYDGWNLVQETINNQQTAITNQYVWGKDVSGTMQGAGGVGGLLAVEQGNAWYFPCYDNNGNITAYIDENGSIVAEYTYDAFGNTIAQSGSMAETFMHRFSTKYYDSETGLYYYGYRFYAPVLHRWMNRDPSGENSGHNLYGFCQNNSVDKWDFLGLWVLNLISNSTTDDDAIIWKVLSKLNGATTVSDIASVEDLFMKAEQQLILHHGEAITELNLSEHGVGGGAGISFLDGDYFDLLRLTDAQKQRLKNLLAPYAKIQLWSCDSAQSETKCRGLSEFAVELGVSVKGKNAAVTSGPDVAGPFVDAIGKVVAYFMKTKFEPEWLEFRPLPSISGPRKAGPPVKRVKVREVQNGE